MVTPAWFSDYVLTVGGVDSTGDSPMRTSLSGPWVSVAAPGTDIEGLSNSDDRVINAIDGPDDSLLVPVSTGFSAAIVSGVAALVRAKYPQLSARQVVNRIVQTARPLGSGVNNEVGHGLVDPVAALKNILP